MRIGNLDVCAVLVEEVGQISKVYGVYVKIVDCLFDFAGESLYLEFAQFGLAGEGYLGRKLYTIVYC